MRARLQRGFTLIELLTTIAVIGILASIIMVSLVTARAKGRDAQRITDLKNIEIALNSYRLENGFYPATAANASSNTGRSWYGNCNIDQPWGVGDLPNVGAGAWIPNLAPTYIQQLPNDPSPKKNQCYIYSSDGRKYMLLALQTVESYVESNNPHPRMRNYPVKNPCATGYTYENDFAVYSDGSARCW